MPLYLRRAGVDAVLRSPGKPLDTSTRATMESRFGHDFGQVRIHSDALAATSTRAVDAEAYTVGPHIAFGTGRYAPATQAGQRLLAHELTHVVQQGADTLDTTVNEAAMAGAAAATDEVEAAQNAERIVSGQTQAAPTVRAGGPWFARQTEVESGSEDQALLHAQANAAMLVNLAISSIDDVEDYDVFEYLGPSRAKPEVFNSYNVVERLAYIRRGYEQMLPYLRDRTMTYTKIACPDPTEIAEWRTDAEIFLCVPAWTKAKMMGIKGKAGTLIHELSHYLLSTDDVQEDPGEAKKLAAESPDKALKNATNWEIFAETRWS